MDAASWTAEAKDTSHPLVSPPLGPRPPSGTQAQLGGTAQACLIFEHAGPSPLGRRRGRSAGSAEMIRYLTEDHDRIAQRMNDVVVRRIFAAGLDLQAGLGPDRRSQGGQQDLPRPHDHIARPLTEYDQQQLRGECEVFDRTGGLTLIFTGRRSIPGIELGSQIRVTGTIGETTGRLTVTDPAYQILAG
jgi:hypothetical protein